MKLHRTEIRFGVADINRSVEFYAKALGFAPATVWPDASPEFAIVVADDVRIQFERSVNARPSTLWIDVEDLDAMHTRVRDLAPIEWGPEVYSYGRKEFSFSDPDGNHIIISEVSTAPAECTVKPAA